MPLTLPNWRRILFRLHQVLGLTLGIVLVVIGVTGALMSYEDEIQAWFDADRIATVTDHRPRLAPEALVARIEAQRPGAKIDALTLPLTPLQTIRARFLREPGGAGRPPSVYADPYDGTVLGAARLEGTFATIRALHRWLLIPGEGKGWGRTITGACAVALLGFLASGLYLRWPKIHRWRIWLKPHLGQPGRRRWWSLHAVLGTWLTPVYLVATLSGLWWSYDGYRQAATWLLTGRPPAAKASRTPVREGPLALDKAWSTFAVGAGQRATRATITFPGQDTGAIRIRWLSIGGEQHSKARDEMTFDPLSGEVLAVKHAGNKPLGQSIADNMLEVHRGRFFGDAMAFVFFLSSLMLPLLPISGFVLYALRRRAARSRSTVESLRLRSQPLANS